jgi:hypothetical protein
MNDSDSTDWADAIVTEALRPHAAAHRRPVRVNRRHGGDAWDSMDDDADAFQRVLAVLPARQRPGQAPLLRIGRRGLSSANTRRALLRAHHGVFLPQASRQQARQWAQTWAQRLGGTVREDAPNGTGLPHFHVELPQGGSSGHIFYGTPPTGLFFDED